MHCGRNMQKRKKNEGMTQFINHDRYLPTLHLLFTPPTFEVHKGNLKIYLDVFYTLTHEDAVDLTVASVSLELLLRPK